MPVRERPGERLRQDLHWAWQGELSLVQRSLPMHCQNDNDDDDDFSLLEVIGAPGDRSSTHPCPLLTPAVALLGWEALAYTCT